MGVRHWIRHTRYVQSGSPPLYRLMLLGALISGIIQSCDKRPPAAIWDNTPSWFSYAIIGSILLGGILALGGLYFADENRHHASRLNTSLNMELIGLIFVQTATIVNLAGVIINDGGFPASSSTWYGLAFSAWMWFRMWDILRVVRKLTKT